MKKMLSAILTTSAATAGLLMAGTVSANADTTYTVEAGDCVWAISQQYHTTIEAIETANNIHGHLILPGQELTIPGVNPSTPVYQPATTTAPAQPASVTAPVETAPVTSAPVEAAPVQSAPVEAAPVQTAPAAPVQAPATTPSYGSDLKSSVLGQMEARTGVSAATWDHIINRESNWQPHVVNSTSGAYGLFQNMHISGGSVQEQVDAAVSLYNVQGMQAWALY